MRTLSKRIFIYLALSLTLMGCQRTKSIGSSHYADNTIELNQLQAIDLMTLSGESKKFKTETVKISPLPKDYRLTEAVGNDDFIYGIMKKREADDKKFFLLQVNRKTGRQRFLIFYKDSEHLHDVSHLEMTSQGPVFSSISEDKSTIHLLNERRGTFERLHEIKSPSEILISSDGDFITYVDVTKPEEAWIYDLETQKSKRLTSKLNQKLGLPYLEGNYITYGTEDAFHLRHRISGEELSLKIQPFEQMVMTRGNEEYLMGISGDQDAPSILVYPLKTAQPELYQSKDLLTITGSMPTLENILIQTKQGICIVDHMNYTLQKLYNFKAGDRVTQGKKNDVGHYQILIEESKGDLKFIEFIESSGDK